MFNLPSANLNRRRLLLGLASASAAGAAVVATGAAVSAAIVNATDAATLEGETLLSLGDQLAAAVEDIRAANGAYWSMVDRWEPLWPSAPDAIVERFGHVQTEEKGFQEGSIMPDGTYYRLTKGDDWNKPHPKPRHLRKASGLATEVRSLDAYMKRHRPKHPLSAEQLMEGEAERAAAVDRLAIATEYEARCAEIHSLSDYRATRARRYAALEAAHQLIGKVMAETPVTMAGVLIQAEALDASKLTEHHHMLGAYEWASNFAATLLSLAREAPAQQA